VTNRRELYFTRIRVREAFGRRACDRLCFGDAVTRRMSVEGFIN
jgi:hypothetical protein